MPRAGRRHPLLAALTRRVWLPRWLYAALPWAYLMLGSVALGAAVLIEHPAWVLPLFVLTGTGLAHLALAVATLRYRRRRRSSPSAAPDLATN